MRARALLLLLVPMVARRQLSCEPAALLFPLLNLRDAPFPALASEFGLDPRRYHALTFPAHQTCTLCHRHFKTPALFLAHHFHAHAHSTLRCRRNLARLELEWVRVAHLPAAARLSHAACRRFFGRELKGRTRLGRFCRRLFVEWRSRNGGVFLRVLRHLLFVLGTYLLLIGTLFAAFAVFS